MPMDPAKRKILVVDDEQSIRNALRTKLESERFTVLEATDGASGLATALKEHPDLILLDIMMPVMDGYAMHEQLRKDAWGNTATVIFLTNVADEQQWVSVFGQPQYLVKSSWSLADVVSIIRKTLGIAEPTISPREKLVTVKTVRPLQ